MAAQHSGRSSPAAFRQQVQDRTAVADIQFDVDVSAGLPGAPWFQRVSPSGPKKTALMLLSTPMTSEAIELK